jgi:GTP-binding protein
MFVDRVAIDVEAGDGGDGCCSFRRERFIPRGGSDGGDGGHGGSVILVAQEGVDSLNAVAHKKHWRADRGRHGEGSNRTGRSGKDLVIKVPLGTVVLDRNTNLVIKDLNIEGEQVTAARGGNGGKGNVHFKSSTNRAPREITKGQRGEHRQLLLELKVIADVGLVGKPNAGKSTLLSRLTRARPEIAAYPFTTKHPNLGQVQVSLDQSFVMADIPGLIEGAHEGVGLGHDFLRHIQRTGVLVHLVEPQPMDGTDPVDNYQNIRSELVQFDAALGDRPEIVVVTKCELGGAEDVRDELAKLAGSVPLVISAVTGQGLNQLSGAIVKALDEVRGRATI